MILLFYNVALVTALILGAPWWLWKLVSAGKYRQGLIARLGRVPERLRGGAPVIWLHAVSVGEVLAAGSLILQIDRAFPGYRLLVSTTTQTGQTLARQRFGAGRVFYCPLDLPWAVSAYLKTLRPKLLILAETEFWPNLLDGCFRHGIPVAVVNARISDRSWPRYRKLRSLWRPLLGQLSMVLAQSRIDAERLVAIGCKPDRVSIAGNLKFDVRAKQTDAAVELKARGRGLRFIVAGSTVEGEEALLLEAWPRILAADAKLVLVLAPRRPERFSAVAAMLQSSGIRWVRRSDWQRGAVEEPAMLGQGEIVLLDTIGELASVYALASAAFVGGSLVAAGGHNPLEPAQFGVPVVMGPHHANFRAITEDLVAQDAIRIVRDEAPATALLEIICDPRAASAMGDRARRVFEQQAGATGRCLDALNKLLGPSAAVEDQP